MLRVSDDASLHPRSPDTTDSPVPAPEQSALLAARRWSLVTAAAIGVLTQVAATVNAWPFIGPLQLAATTAALVIVIVGSVLSRHPGALWALTGGGWLLVAANALPGAQEPWLFINATALFGAFGIGLIIRRSLVIPAAILFPLLLHASWQANPGTVLATGFAAFDGWIPPTQVAAVIVAMSLLWSSLVRQSWIMDAAFHAHLRAEATAIEARARGRARRRAAIAVHESLLNTIRSVVTVESVERISIAGSLHRVSRLLAAPPAVPTLGSLRERVLQDADGPSRIELTAPVSLPMSDDAFEALRAALVELIRNRLRHGDGQPCLIRLGTTGDHLVAEISGTPWYSEPLRSGLGLRTAVEAGINAVGGSTHRSRDRTVLEVPTTATPMTIGFGPTSVFSRSRALMSTWLAAMVVGGVLYFLALIPGAASVSMSLAMPVLAMAGATATFAVSWRRHERSLIAVVPLIAIPIAIPWIARWVYAAGCPGQEQVLTSALNVSGFMLLVLALWSRWWLLIPSMCLWLGGLVSLAAEDASNCGSTAVLAAFNSLVFLPAIIAVILIAGRFYARAERIRNDQIAREIIETTAVTAQEEVLGELEALIRQAAIVLDRVAAEGDLRRSDRQELMRLEGRIRVAVQVDPQDCGAFGRLALLLVDEGAEHAGSVKVGAIEPSGDPRPIPEQVTGVLRAIVRGRRPALAAFSDGQADYLTVTSSLDEQSIPAPGLEGAVLIADVELSIDHAADDPDDSRRVMALVIRPIDRGSEDVRQA